MYDVGYIGIALSFALGVMMRLDSALAKKRLIGLVLMVCLLGVFILFNRFPKLDTVREDLNIVTATTVECFQGFCIEREPDTNFLTRWWEFSIGYLELVSIGMAFAFLMAGLTEAFLFKANKATRPPSSGLFKRTLKGLAIGPLMNLCSACIVPVSSTFRRTGLGMEGAISMVQGSATLNLPSLIMVALVFTPLLGASRLITGILAALLIGPAVALVIAKSKGEPIHEHDEMPEPIDDEEAPWGPVLIEALKDWAKSSAKFFVRLGPIMVVAGFASGLAIQWVTPEVVTTYLGNGVMAVLIAATFGILINVPLLFEIPLVALLLLLGMGPAPAATILFAAAAGGPVTFWGLARSMPKKAIFMFASSTWLIGVLGGVLILGFQAIAPDVKAGLRSVGFSGSEQLPAIIKYEKHETDIQFKDVTLAAGLDHKHSPVSEKFTNAENGMMAGGAVAEDFDGDGWVDLFVLTGGSSDALLYMNQKNGTFKDEALERGAALASKSGMAAAAADYDNDGDIDIFVSNDFPPHDLLVNQGEGSFVAGEVPMMQPSAFATSPSWGDVNNDGLLELVLGEWNPIQAPIMDAIEDGFIDSDPEHPYWALWMYKNKGNGYLEPYQFRVDSINVSRENFVFSPRFADFDGDFNLDLAVVSDFGRSKLYLNRGDGKFDNFTSQSGVGSDENGMGSAIGDFDNDGDLDWFVSSVYDESAVKEGPWGGSGNRLFRNRGDASFDDATLFGVRDGNWGWGSSFGDLDNDGDLDIYQVTGWANAEKISVADIKWNNQPARLFENLMELEGEIRFADVASPANASDKGQGRGVILFDFDNDGDLDVFLTNNHEFSIEDQKAIRSPAQPTLFRNDTSLPNHWIKVTVEAETPLHRDGLGCKVYLRVGDITQMRELHASTNFAAQEPGRIAHFGLGDSEVADEIRIECAGETVGSKKGVVADQHIRFRIRLSE